jgi:hypothetical protein
LDKRLSAQEEKITRLYNLHGKMLDRMDRIDTTQSKHNEELAGTSILDLSISSIDLFAVLHDVVKRVDEMATRHEINVCTSSLAHLSCSPVFPLCLSVSLAHLSSLSLSLSLSIRVSLSLYLSVSRSLSLSLSIRLSLSLSLSVSLSLSLYLSLLSSLRGRGVWTTRWFISTVKSNQIN